MMVLLLLAARTSQALLRPARTRTEALLRPARTRAALYASWRDLGLAEDLAARAEKHWAEPNAVQRAAVPAILAGEDAVVGAETGSGKTLAYLLPAAHVASEAAKGAEQPSARAGRVDMPRRVVLPSTRVEGEPKP